MAATRQEQLNQIAATIKAIQAQTAQVTAGVQTLSTAKAAGMTIAPTTTVQQAAAYVAPPTPTPTPTYPTPTPTAQVLTPEQIKQYYADPNNQTNPLSPLDWLKKQTTTPPTITEIPEIIEDTDLGAGELGVPNLPIGDGVSTFNALVDGLTQDLENRRKALEDMYNKQLKDLQTKIDASNTKISDITAKQETTLDKAEGVLSPFREQLEKDERERLKIEENFFANQESLQELETLLTQVNAEIEAAKAVTGLDVIRTPRINKLKEDLIARVGVIEAVMATRNNQITVAENMIDRTSAAIQADRSDQLVYYQAILDFHEGQKEVEGAKLLTLRSEEKEFLDKQINLLENDMKISQDSVGYIKSLMIDPNTANLMQKSGVLLTDNPVQIQKRFSDYTYSQELINTKNEMEINGYKYMTNADAAGKPEGELSVITDSRGIERTYWKETTATSATSTFSTSQTSKGSLIAGVSNEEFDAFDEETKNYFINGDVNGSKSDITKALEDTDEPVSADTLIREINSMDIPQEVKDVLIKHTNDEAARLKAREGTFEDFTLAIGDSVLNLKNQNFAKDEARDYLVSAYKGELDLKADEDLPKAYEDAIDKAIDNTYGGTGENIKDWFSGQFKEIKDFFNFGK